MEFGRVSRIKSKLFNDSIVLFHSLKSPGYVYKFSRRKAAVIAEFTAYNEVRVQLSKHRTVRCTPVPDPLNILESLRVTLRGREAVDGDLNKDEPFLLYSGQGGRLLAFCA